MTDNLPSDICRNCGAHRELHHYQSMQCPINGVEMPVGMPDVWADTSFEPLKEISNTWVDLAGNKPDKSLVSIDMDTYNALVAAAAIAQELQTVMPVTDELQLVSAMNNWRKLAVVADGIKMEIERYILSKKNPGTVVFDGIRARYNSPRASYDHKGAVLEEQHFSGPLREKLNSMAKVDNLDSKIYTDLSKEFKLKPVKSVTGSASVTLSLD